MKKLGMHIRNGSGTPSWKGIFALGAGMIICAGASIATAQYAPGPDTPPPPDPGYGQFYHEDSAPNYAARWGYHDGYQDGRHDRMHNHSFRPTQDDHYKHAPEYGHPRIRRDDYKQIYREAYVHGYEGGYRANG
jgi:hypothetical protein